MVLLAGIKTPCRGVCCSDGGNNRTQGYSASKLLMYFYEEALEPLHTHASMENGKTASLFCCPQLSVARQEAEGGWMREAIPFFSGHRKMPRAWLRRRTLFTVASFHPLPALW